MNPLRFWLFFCVKPCMIRFRESWAWKNHGTWKNSCAARGVIFYKGSSWMLIFVAGSCLYCLPLISVEATLAPNNLPTGERGRPSIFNLKLIFVNFAISLSQFLISNSLLPVSACCDSRCPFLKYLLRIKIKLRCGRDVSSWSSWGGFAIVLIQRHVQHTTHKSLLAM